MDTPAPVSGPYWLFLDDERLPRAVTWVELPVLGPWTVVRSYDAFISIIASRGLPLAIAFDHDLGIEHLVEEEWPEAWKLSKEAGTHGIPYDQFKTKTWYHCALWLIDYCLDREIKTLPIWVVHSMNPIGKANIEELLRGFENAQVEVLLSKKELPLTPPLL